MAGDWIKLEVTTPDKPEMVRMAELLSIDQDAVVGKCVRLWIWADSQSIDGNALSVTDSFIDRITYSPGFANALRQVGWLSGRHGLLAIPNFDRHNGQTAKNRALTKSRVAKSRSECNAPSVTKPLPEREKRRDSYPSISASEVVIPEKMQTAEVQQAAGMWFAHLEVSAPDKIPVRGSPQEQAFWAEASRLGPAAFVRSVEHCVARGWKNLRPVDERSVETNATGRRRKSSTAQEREDANADAFATLFASIGGETSENAG